MLFKETLLQTTSMPEQKENTMPYQFDETLPPKTAISEHE
jgi:uncharacterized membrane protein